ncbi:hypothetical protein DPEC_G00220880 [Dallia pectoralis]|uniref:Uncharacterized protein n=1 Tax=Dallia pectoralis TaxID=75939 RepID=A0ACC2G474_DALPE|nr:hypothetical protein DPEC_G00220880 [Dallia pectoralis]
MLVLRCSCHAWILHTCHPSTHQPTLYLPRFSSHSSSDCCFRNSELNQVFVLDHQQTKPSTSLAVRTPSTYSSSPDHPL